jgi:opacity protein-like surface antigen
MKRTVALTVVALVATAAVVAPPVSAQEGDVTVQVSVAGERYDDGERVEVEADELRANVTVDSDNDLNAFRSTLHTKSVIVGVTGNSYNTTHVLETRPGPNDYTVTVEDVDGNVARHTVNFYKEATSPRELRQVVDRLQNRKERLEDEIDELRNRRDELNETRQELQQQLNQTRNDGGGGNTDEPEQEPQGLPGFGVVVALLAVALVSMRRRHK